jgi:hypothetical protein
MLPPGYSLESYPPPPPQMLGNNVHVTNVAAGPVWTNVASIALKGGGSALYGNSHQTGGMKQLVASGMTVKR